MGGRREEEVRFKVVDTNARFRIKWVFGGSSFLTSSPACSSCLQVCSLTFMASDLTEPVPRTDSSFNPREESRQINSMSDRSKGCPRCSFDIARTTEFELHEIPPTGVLIASLGKKIDPRRSFTGCRLCQFLQSVRSTYGVNYKLQLRLFKRFLSKASEQNGCEEVFLALVRDDQRLRYDSDIQNEVGKNGVIALPGSQSVHPVSRTVNYDFLKSCITKCVVEHECSPVPNSGACDLSYINLIDCNQQVLTQMPLETDYLALSYVWGRQVHQKEIHPERSALATMSELPLTIRDAMSVTQGLGMKYLWVDCLCIDQHDGEEKTTMLRNMDQIYSQAIATIVALYGGSGMAGLPGVSSVQREEQPAFPASQGIFRSTLKPLEAAVEQSVWATRGWTYQESRLSRRCLYFTGAQVYFSCMQHTRSEAVPFAADTSAIPPVVNKVVLGPSLHGWSVFMAGDLFLDTLHFTSRVLTYPTDILDAFRGILHRSGFVTFFGVPILPLNSKLDPNIGFSMGLLWGRNPRLATNQLKHSTSETVSVYSRRNGFPSWSWKSVSGGIWHDSHGPETSFVDFLNGSQEVQLNVSPSAKYFIQSAKGHFEPIETIIRRSGSSMISELYTEIQVEGDIVQVPIYHAVGLYTTF